MKIGFIGCGNMGSALAKAASLYEASEIFIADNDIKKAQSVATKLQGFVSKSEEIAEKCDVIFLGVKPQVLPIVAKELKNTLSSRTSHFVLVSMAAGVKIETIESMFCPCPVIRIMPNTPAMIKKGLILYCNNEKATDTDVTEFLKIVENAGICEPIEESLIDAGCAVSGCGPAFVYMFIEALAKGGVKAGLSPDMALKYAAATVRGAAEMVLKTGTPPETLCQNVCSPNGSTIEGVNHLQSTDFEQNIIDTVMASYKRTVELGKE